MQNHELDELVDSAADEASPSEWMAAIVLVLACVLVCLPVAIAISGSSELLPGFTIAIGFGGLLLVSFKGLWLAHGLFRFFQTASLAD